MKKAMIFLRVTHAGIARAVTALVYADSHEQRADRLASTLAGDTPPAVRESVRLAVRDLVAYALDGEVSFNPERAAELHLPGKARLYLEVRSVDWEF